MRFSVNLPNFGDFADPSTVARVALAAEQAGWDGLFVWDHVVHDKRTRRGQAFGDPLDAADGGGAGNLAAEARDAAHPGGSTST
jgi:alkanesulfonate monooxygenase SsuD/methylene tetrahydromethanopterin reductase-like flavin-dependent oxidoreductase (luciferase family)